jgi:hypothetical protein
MLDTIQFKCFRLPVERVRESELERMWKEAVVAFLRYVPTYMRVYPKASGLAAWSENCKWYSSLCH